MTNLNCSKHVFAMKFAKTNSHQYLLLFTVFGIVDVTFYSQSEIIIDDTHYKFSFIAFVQWVSRKE